MSQLHTLNHPSLLDSCLRIIGRGDRLLLLEDGVYCACHSEFTERTVGIPVYVVNDDLLARGLEGRVDVSAQRVTMAGFVQLCCEADQIVNWF